VTRALAIAALVGAAGALPSAAEAAHGHVSVRAVSAPRTAAAGGSVSADVRVARTRRAPAAKVRFYLSTDRRRDGRDVHLAGDVRLRAGGKPRAIQMEARPEVPAGQALGDYRLLACIGKRCRPSKGPLKITSQPVGTRELVEAAVAAHRLTPEQSLVYRTFAALGDPRLPASYRGDDAEPEDLVMREVVAKWSTLSRSQKATLNPYFTPPAAKNGPWPSRRAGAASVRPIPLVQPTCDTNQAASRDWLTIAKPGGHVRIWWLKDDDKRVGPRARSLLTDIENHMWPRLVAIFGREPLRDGRERCFHGVDDKLDIYMWGLPRARAMTFAYPPDCAGSPAYIVFDSRSTLPRPWEIAHELMHAFQFSYDYEASCSSYNDWDEAVATWAAAWLYPQDDEEHAYRWLLRDPDESLVDADYEGWAFAYAMAQLHGPGTIASIYAESERRPDVLHAIDAGLPGGLHQAWPEFAKVAWNQDPVEPNFEGWDGFKQHPEQDGHEIATQRVDVGPSGLTEVDIPLGMNPLTRAYRRLDFGPSVTQITVHKPSLAGVSVQAMLRLRDGTIRTEDWSTKSEPYFCPRNPAERPDELLLVISNSSLTQASPSNVQSQVRVAATNVGCSRYRGEASGSSNLHGGDTNIDETWTATGLVYDRILETSAAPRFLFALTGGSVTWSLTGTTHGCSVKAGPVTLPVRTDGTDGELDMRVFESSSGATPTMVHDYFVDGYGLPAVQGTETCPNGSTLTRSFVPTTFLSSSVTGTPRPIPGNGVLEGTESGSVGSGRTETYRWHLVPDR
jgi:uncharacterized protein DUF6055